MRRNTYSFPTPGSKAKRRSRKKRVPWTTLMIGAIISIGMLHYSAALGSHLSLPGSQDLHHSQDSGNQPLIRQLETINNYTSPHSRSTLDTDLDAGASPIVEDSAVTSTPRNPPIATELETSPLFHSTTMRKPVPSEILIHQNDPQGHVNMGWKFLLNGQLQAALAAYRESLRQNPNSANAYVGMGITLKSIGNVEQAKQAIQQALKLNPRLSSALVHLGYLYADGHVGHSDPATARRLFDQASQLGDPFASIALLDLQSRSKL